MQAGKLSERVTLQSKQVARNGIGEEVVTWADIATVWAQVEPLRGREFFAASQMQTSVDVRMRIRYGVNVGPEDRALWRGQPHDIVSVIEPNAERTMLELMCVSGVRDGR
jgi:SPP1 family predicted phage head-tail adaptor